ncbi:helix-turn-helix domain-containing protein [Aquiflexum sp.]|uniref:helix-turn-helix domain-containing protein n=1 Tax=Aquiflexum sp. TaxID=1872584 RepID=UPI00359426AB
MKIKTLDDIQLAKELISPPGDTLLETINLKGISQTDLAKRMGRPLKTINEIIQGKAAITPETAIQLERSLDIPASFWLERERNYRLEFAEIEDAEQLIQQKDWLNNFPIKQMMTMGWIAPRSKDVVDLMDELLKFFGIGGKDAFYEATCFAYIEGSAFRLTNQDKKNPYALAAWLKQGEKQAEQMVAGKFEKNLFKANLEKIKDVMVALSEDFFAQLQALCAEAGVKLVNTPKLPNSKVHGSTRWLNDTPLIQLSNQFMRNDIFWFTFFHEAGHILKHGKKELFVEGLSYSQEGEKKEEEANQFAVESIFSEKEEREFMALAKVKGLTIDLVYSYAKEIHTHPAIIVGRLEHDGLLRHGQGIKHGIIIKIELE